MKGRISKMWVIEQQNRNLKGGLSTRKFVQSFQILYKSALMTYAPFRELKVIRQQKAIQYTELFKHQGHSARSPIAHLDEFVYSAQVTLLEELDQLRIYRHSATSPLGYITTRLHRHSATRPRAQQLTLTSSSTLDRSRYLRS